MNTNTRLAKLLVILALPITLVLIVWGAARAADPRLRTPPPPAMMGYTPTEIRVADLDHALTLRPGDPDFDRVLAACYGALRARWEIAWELRDQWRFSGGETDDPDYVAEQARAEGLVVELIYDPAVPGEPADRVKITSLFFRLVSLVRHDGPVELVLQETADGYSEFALATGSLNPIRRAAARFWPPQNR